MLDLATTLLDNFVSSSARFYGSGIYVLNFHSLIHIVDDARNFWPLDSLSCFPFENYLQQLKRLLRSPHRPLSQISNRLFEADKYPLRQRHSPSYILRHPHHDGPLTDRNCATEQFKRIDLREYCIIAGSESDSTVQLLDGSLAVLKIY